MRKLLLLLAAVLFYVACNQNNAPKGIIAKEKMLNVLLDMQLTDAALTLVYNSDTMKMQAKSRYQYLFKKYGIDSATFTNSLKFYSEEPAQLDSMYSMISDSLTRLKEKLEAEGRYTEPLQNYILKGFTFDSPKFINPGYYLSDIATRYQKYKLTKDTVNNKVDSLTTNKTDNLKNSKLKNDLSAK
ncbi:MAG TPA: DUF4296 domain-containing protein [Pelobium sp.]